MSDELKNMLQASVEADATGAPSAPDLIPGPINNPQAATSPLLEVDPMSVDELWSRIDRKLALGLPNEVTNDDLRRVVEYNLANRRKFIADQQAGLRAGPSGPRKSKPRSAKEAMESVEIVI
jgi:hypothetical protein